jgi:iron complex transport system substrate-binding protein
MRIASLQPSITLILEALGQLDHLCAHTRYCLEALPDLAARNLPVIHDAWTADAAEIIALNPTIVLASVPYRMESLAAILKSHIPILALAPHTLADILNDIRLLANLTNASAAGDALIHRFQTAIDDTRQQTVALPRPRVYCEEWGKPMIHSQSWVAELVAAAGGDFLGTPGAHTTPEAIATLNPDVLLFAWCGAGNRVPLSRVIEQRGWQQLPAVVQGRVFCIPDQLLNTPAQTLLGGLACLAHAIHPGHFPQPSGLVQLAEQFCPLSP